MQLQELADEIAEANFVLGFYHAFTSFGWPWVSNNVVRQFWTKAGKAAEKRIIVHQYINKKAKTLVHHAYNEMRSY